MLHRLLDVDHGKAVVGRLASQFGELSVGSEAKPNDLLDIEPVIEWFAGQHEVAEILFRPNRAILHFHCEDTGEEEQQEHREGDDHQEHYRGSAMVVADVPVKIHEGEDERDDDQSEQNTVEHRHELRVFFITLLFHAL